MDKRVRNSIEAKLRKAARQRAAKLARSEGSPTTRRVWIADPAGVYTADLAAAQQSFGGKLTIAHSRGGHVVIYPEAAGDRSAFDAFMEKNGRFEQRPIQLATI